MPHPRLFCSSQGRIALALVFLLFLGTGAHPPVPATLTSRINAIISDAPVNSALWGIYVVDLQTGRPLYRLNETSTMIPASNLKLLTTATALDVLGPDYRYTTRLHHVGTIENGTLRGDLILEGAGDPTFGSQAMEGPDPLVTWANQLKAQGVTRIEGRIIGDDNIFAEEPYADGWDVSYIGRESWAAPAGGLSYRDNLVDLILDAPQVGQAPTLEEEPAGYLSVRNRVTTRGRRSHNGLTINRPLGSETVVLEGAVRQAYRGTLRLPVNDPTAFTLHAFREHLRRAGIHVEEASFIDIDALDAPPTYDTETPLLTHTSPPLHEMVPLINKASNNFYAEQVFRTFSWGGTTNGSGRRVVETLSQLDVPVRGLSIQDGSGLSRKDMVTPEAMVSLLAKMYLHPARDIFLASLPRGGEDRTTLEYRLVGVPAQAKTGSLGYARALSGYVTSASGRPLAFSILANHYSAPSYRIQEAIDAIVVELTAPSDG